MNIFDGIVIFILGYSIYGGFRSGAVAQLFSFVGLILSVWIGVAFGGEVADLLGIKSSGAIWGFLILFFVVIISITLLSRMIRNVLNFVGLGGIDKVVGVVLSFLKYVIVLSIIFNAVIEFNRNFNMIEQQQLKSSRLFFPIASVIEFLPVWKWVDNFDVDDVSKHIENGEKQIEKGWKESTQEL